MVRVLLVLMLACPEARPQERFDRRVEGALERAKGRVVASQRPDGSFSHRLGEHALAMLALLHVGMAQDDPVILRALRPLRGSDVRTYDVAVRLMVLSELQMPALRALAEADARVLISGQESSGGFGYGTKQPAGYVDNSCTQYALLGLRAAHLLQIPVPKKVWTSALRYLVKQVGVPGGAGYQTAMSGTASMTAGVLSSLVIAFGQTSDELDKTALTKATQAIDRTTQWLAKNWHPGHRQQPYYTAYGMERAMAFSRITSLEGRDWYRDGALWLLAAQLPDGSFSPASGAPVRTFSLETCFAILFLARGSRPIAGEHGTSVSSLLASLSLQSRPAEIQKVVTALAAKKTREARAISFYLTDAAVPVRRAAWEALRRLSGGQDFGYDPDLTNADNEVAIAKWNQWAERLSVQ